MNTEKQKTLGERIAEKMAGIDGVSLTDFLKKMHDHIEKLPIGHWKYLVQDTIGAYNLSQDEAEAGLRFAENYEPELCSCGVPNDLHSTTMCGWDAALMPSDSQGMINDKRHPGCGKPFMSWKNNTSLKI